MTRLHLARLVAAVLGTAAAGLTVLGVPAPAAAATCSTASGVSVIVDFKQLGGGIQGSCVASGGGQRASALFPSAGFQLEYVQGEAFVCRISGLPTQDDEACNDTPPADAYWGLWWSDGTSGTWSYSSYGVSALKIPDGGYVAFAWKAGSAPASAPGVAPAAHQTASPAQSPSSSPTKSPSSSPTRTPSSQPTKSPTSNPTSAGTTTSASGSASGSASESTSTSESASPTESLSPTESASPSAAETPSAAGLSSPPVVQEPSDPVDAEAVTDGDGVPIAIVLVLILGLFAAAAGAVVLRRRQAP